MKKIVIMSLLLALVAIALPAQTAELREARTGATHPMMRWNQELNLSQQQIDKIGEARNAYEKQKNTITSQIKNLNMDINDAIQKQDFRKAKTLNGQLTTKELELKNARIDMISAIMRDLSSEQREAYLKRYPMGMTQGFQRQPQMGQRNVRQRNRDDSCYPSRDGRNSNLRRERVNKRNFRQASPKK